MTVGENFRFGHGAEGDAARLQADGRFETRVAPLLEVDAEVVSSSHIRGLVLGGAVEYADELLGAPFTLTREVVHGDKRGRELGFPTANLLPADGYVTPGPRRVRVPRDDGRRRDPRGGDERRRAADVRHRPRRADRGVPARLRRRPLRRSRCALEFLKRLRGEKRFESVEALIEQMDRDVDEARAIAG